MDTIVVRTLVSSDISKVRELHSKLLPVQYPPSFFLHLLVLPNRTCFVAYRDNTLVGFISAAIQQQPNANSPDFPPFLSPASPDLQNLTTLRRLEILTLGVLPSYQHCGLARLLLQRVIENFRESNTTGTPKSCASNSTSFGRTPLIVHANVATSNLSAIKFYERMGMKVSSNIIKNLYRSLSSGSKDAYLVVGVV